MTLGASTLNPNHNAHLEMNTVTPSQDILKRFPYEIWSKCILAVIYRDPEEPLPFLSVSSHWQALLLDSPAMWSYIHINIDDGEDMAARITPSFIFHEIII
jgi:hypothetical protein